MGNTSAVLANRMARNRMPRLLFQESEVAPSCHMVLAELNRADAIALYPAPGEEDPDIGVGPGSLFVATRCPGLGEVNLEIWAGNPDKPQDWETLFDGTLETRQNGFAVGEAAHSYHIAAPPGQYRVRVDVHRDKLKEVDAVRFVFPDDDQLAGEQLEG